jgi:aryl-alcohol dehydrogenase-like predicted oxidoreductase
MLLDQKVGMMVWSPLSGGLLTGKYQRNGQKGEGRLNSFPFPPFHEQRAYDVLDVLIPIAAEKNTSVAQLALAWVMQQPAVSTVIIGATKPHQLQDNLRALNVIFTPDELIQLNKVSDLPVEYPGNVLDIMTLDRRSGIDFQKS